MFAIEIDIYVS